MTAMRSPLVEQPAQQRFAIAGEGRSGSRRASAPGSESAAAVTRKMNEADHAAGPIDESVFALVRDDGAQDRPRRRARRGRRRGTPTTSASASGERQLGPVGRHVGNGRLRRCTRFYGSAVTANVCHTVSDLAISDRSDLAGTDPMTQSPAFDRHLELDAAAVAHDANAACCRCRIWISATRWPRRSPPCR